MWDALDNWVANDPLNHQGEMSIILELILIYSHSFEWNSGYKVETQGFAQEAVITIGCGEDRLTDYILFAKNNCCVQ